MNQGSERLFYGHHTHALIINRRDFAIHEYISTYKCVNKAVDFQISQNDQDSVIQAVNGINL